MGVIAILGTAVVLLLVLKVPPVTGILGTIVVLLLVVVVDHRKKLTRYVPEFRELFGVDPSEDRTAARLAVTKVLRAKGRAEQAAKSTFQRELDAAPMQAPLNGRLRDLFEEANRLEQEEKHAKEVAEFFDFTTAVW